MSENDPELSRLYREASADEPPAVVDAAILAAAWKPVAKPERSEGPQRRARSLWSRWIAPAGAIATLVLGVSIALLVERERPETIGGTAGRQTPQRSQSWPPAPVTESAKPEAGDGAAAEAAAAPAPSAPAHAPELIAPAPAAPAPSAQEAAPAESRARMAAPTTAPPTAATESNSAGDSATGGSGAGAPAAPAAAGELAPLRQHAIVRSPEAWLDEISRLRREGRDIEAAEQLTEFRKAYPAHAVPENLLR